MAKVLEFQLQHHSFQRTPRTDLLQNGLVGSPCSDAGREWGQEEKGTTEDEMAGWHYRLNGCEFEEDLGFGDGQVGLV